MGIAADVIHLALSRDLTAEQAGAEALQVESAAGEDVVARNLIDLCAKSRCPYIQMLAIDVPDKRQGVDQRNARRLVILQLTACMDEPRRQRGLLEDSPELACIDERIILRLHLRIVIVIDRCIQ